jgi:hypothetical protein
MRFSKVPSLKTPGVDPGGWNPGMTSTAPTCWLDANYGITKDTSNRVSAWASKVGSVSFTQTTDGNKPVWTVNSINGLPALVFDGSDDIMTSTATIANLLSASAETIFAVIKPTTLPGTRNWITFSGGYHPAVILESNALGTAIYDTGSRATTIAATAGRTAVVEVRHQGGLLYIKNNQTESTAATAANIGNTTGTLTLGASSNSPNGSLSELITYNTALSAEDRTQVYNYLARKWLGT